MKNLSCFSNFFSYVGYYKATLLGGNHYSNFFIIANCKIYSFGKKISVMEFLATTYLELLRILVILEYIPIFFSKRTLFPFFNVAECKVVSNGALFHPGATLKLEERGKCRKYSKVPIYFVQGCSSQRTRGTLQVVRWPCEPIILSIGHFGGPIEVQLISW